MSKTNSAAKSNGADDKVEHDAAPVATESHEQDESASADTAPSMATTVTTVGVVAVAAALFEAALLPGLVLGVGAMLVPKLWPRLSSGVQPMFRGVVRGAYRTGQKARHAVAEAQEQVHDMIAEAKAEPQPAPVA